MGRNTTSRTPEERREQAEALHASIAAQVAALSGSAEWTRFLDFMRSFHSYSLNNVLLILAQCPQAQYVAGFRQWQAKGRQVRKGERAIRIFGYSTRTIVDEDEHGEETERKVPRFPVLSVFDIGQTDLIEGARDPSPTKLLTGTNDHGIIEALTCYLDAQGWTVAREPLGGSKNGYAEPKRRAVVVDSNLAPEQAAKTLIHETAHVVMGHSDDLAAYAEHRGLMETEAESVAYVVAGLIGFDTAAYSVGYITGWAKGDADMIKSTAARVLTAAHIIADHLAPAQLGQDQAA